MNYSQFENHLFINGNSLEQQAVRLYTKMLYRVSRSLGA